jgi:hypothetical protein
MTKLELEGMPRCRLARFSAFDIGCFDISSGEQPLVKYRFERAAVGVSRDLDEENFHRAELGVPQLVDSLRETQIALNAKREGKWLPEGWRLLWPPWLRLD